MDATASAAAAAGTGRRRQAPDSRSARRVPVPCSSAPTVRNSGALNRPWARSSAVPASAAVRVPSPSRTMSRPSWLTVP
ncbi:hypothetical protein LUX73_07075 [Actinomadura madurae]|nr:hypothetical protein [Actinomadura madurae]MCQ0004500.1 hypothetical protein [Actinomadura madurae]